MQPSGWCGELWFDVLTLGSDMAKGVWGKGSAERSKLWSKLKVSCWELVQLAVVARSCNPR